MSEPYVWILEDDDDDAGIHREQLANAVSCWVWMQQRPVSVAEAATQFNTTVPLIRQAVGDHGWMFARDDIDPTKQIIEHDGE